MDQRADPRGRRPFLSEQQDDEFALLRQGLRGQLTSRPDDADPLRLPDGWDDFLLCEKFGWTWQQARGTPVWVRERFLRFIDERAAAQADQQQEPADPHAEQQSAASEIARAQAALPDFQPPT